MANRRSTALFVSLLAVSALLLGASTFFVVRVSATASAVARARSGARYSWRLALIGQRTDSPFWREVYAGAQEAGEARGAVVEFIGPSSDADSRTTDEYLSYAVATRADGILAYISDEAATGLALGRARDGGIPVVALENDTARGDRQSFVGVSGFELGKKIGSLVDSPPHRQGDVLVLLNPGTMKSSENVMMSGLFEVASSVRRIKVVSSSLTGSSGENPDERLRSLVLNDRNLSTVVCLSVEDTMRAVQAIIELNRGDSISVIAFRESPDVLEYVRKGLVSEVIAIDARQMGRKAVESMLEFLETGNSNDYVITDMRVVTAETLAGGSP